MNATRLALIAALSMAAFATAAAFAWLDPFDRALVAEALRITGVTAVGCVAAHGIRRR